MSETDIKKIIAAGQKELAADRAREKKAMEDNLHRLRADTARRLRKSWGFLCVEAKIDLEDLAEHVDWKQPAKWDMDKTCHWFHIRIPGCSTVIAEYERLRDYEWYQKRWGVACYNLNGDAIAQSWLAFCCEDKSVAYVLALAKEQHAKQKEISSKIGQKKIGLAGVVFSDVSDERIAG